MEVRRFAIGPFQSNCYLLVHTDSKEFVVIDPGMGAEPVYDEVDKLLAEGYKNTYILLTHGHLDHVAGVKTIKEKTSAPVYIHEIEKDWLTDPQLNRSANWGQLMEPITGPPPDVLMQHGQIIHFAGSDIEVRFTPGHTPGHVCFILGEVIFAGDTLFQGSVGRTDLPGGDHGTLIRSIRDQLLTLPEESIVLPGHGPSTTIGDERRHNPFLQGAV